MLLLKIKMKTNTISEETRSLAKWSRENSLLDQSNRNINSCLYALEYLTDTLLKILIAHCGGNFNIVQNQRLDEHYTFMKQMLINSTRDIPFLRDKYLEGKLTPYEIKGREILKKGLKKIASLTKKLPESIFNYLKHDRRHWNAYLRVMGEIKAVVDNLIQTIGIKRDTPSEHDYLIQKIELADKEIETHLWHRGNDNDNDLPVKTPNKKIKKNNSLKLSFGDLSISDNKLKYKDQSISISLSNQAIQFLILLLESNGDLVKYETISNTIHVGYTKEPKELYRNINTIKNNLGKYLKKQGLKKEYAEEIKQMIKAEPSKGYKLLPTPILSEE